MLPLLVGALPLVALLLSLLGIDALLGGSLAVLHGFEHLLSILLTHAALLLLLILLILILFVLVLILFVLILVLVLIFVLVLVLIFVLVLILVFVLIFLLYRIFLPIAISPLYQNFPLPQK